MTCKINDGGPAFPQHVFTPMPPGGGQWSTVGGLSQRDHIAIQAMNGLLAAGRDYILNDYQIEVMSKSAYRIADAMLAAREVVK